MCFLIYKGTTCFKDAVTSRVIWSAATNEAPRAWSASISSAASFIYDIPAVSGWHNGASPVTLRRKMRSVLGLHLGAGAALEDPIWLPVQFRFPRKIGANRVCALIIMHPMPVCSVSGGDIFDCIQRGNVEQCIHFIQTDRSVLKQKGKEGRVRSNEKWINNDFVIFDLLFTGKWRATTSGQRIYSL